MHLLPLTATALAAVALYALARTVARLLAHRRRVMRQRVALLLWTLAQEDEHEPPTRRGGDSYSDLATQDTVEMAWTADGIVQGFDRGGLLT